MRLRDDGLIRPVIAVWASWLGLVALLAGLLLTLAWHPHFLPVTACLVALAGSWVILVVGAGWRIVRGPARVRAWAWLLIGSAPVCFEGGHALYGARTGQGRRVTYGPAFKLLLPLGESVMDLEARFRYPERTAGAKVVMISAPIERAREQVAAMDRHVEALEARLGRTMVGRVHWARGPLFGMESKALFGLCLGSRPGQGVSDAEGLTTLDRHEVAHCVASNFCPVTAEPPALLSEGWAEANMGRDPGELDARLWDMREQGQSGTLAKLTGPDWYGRHEWAAYVHGAPLVNYLLREFGPERFLKWYITCRPGTVDADCRAALGVGLDELDRNFWADLGRGIGKEPARVRRLRRLKLGPGVTPEAWRTFLDAYLADAGRLLAPYAESRVVAERVHASVDPAGQSSEFRHRLEFVRSGGVRGYRSTSKRSSAATVADPLRSFGAQRHGPGAPWVVRRFPDGDADRAYRRALSRYEGIDFTTFAPFLLLQSEEWGNWSDLSTIRVVGLDRLDDGGKRTVRVRLDDTRSDGHYSWRSLALTLAVDADHAAQAVEEVFPDGSKGVGRFEYDGRDGVPLIREFRLDQTMLDGKRGNLRFTVLDRHFGPTPAADLAEDRWLDGPREVKGDPPEKPARTLADAYPLLIAMGVASLIGGAALLIRDRSRGHAANV